MKRRQTVVTEKILQVSFNNSSRVLWAQRKC